MGFNKMLSLALNIDVAIRLDLLICRTESVKILVI